MEYFRHDALLPLRCLLLQNIEVEKWRKLTEMQSHMECRGPGTEAYEYVTFFSFWLNSVYRIFEDIVY